VKFIKTVMAMVTTGITGEITALISFYSQNNYFKISQTTYIIDFPSIEASSIPKQDRTVGAISI
jgi:hypothetical protein